MPRAVACTSGITRRHTSLHVIPACPSTPQVRGTRAVDGETALHCRQRNSPSPQGPALGTPLPADQILHQPAEAGDAAAAEEPRTAARHCRASQ